ncbi:hypothetical protein KW785_02920 [Candidatus Parcubacteria bacterium]|nr:hypothetical protein [Candidatus Parcubacteria bacterium]
MPIKIAISGDGLHFEGETNLIKASQVIAFLATESSSVTQEPYQRSIASAILDKPKSSPREALNEAQAKTNPQKIAVIGKYLMDRDGVESFSAAEVRETLKKSGEPLPANFGRDLKDAIKYGYIYQSGQSDDAYSITDAASEKIRSGFIGGDVPNGNKGAAHKKRKASNPSGKASIVRDEVKNFDFPVDFKGLSYWNDGLNKGERILWLIAVADEKSIHNISAQEISFLASRMKDDIPSKNIPAHTLGHFKKSRVKNVGGGKYQILRGGLDYLEGYKKSGKPEEPTADESR